MKRLVAIALMGTLLASSLFAQEAAEDRLRLGFFKVNATPPIGSNLAYVENTWRDQPLTCRGLVLTGSEKPIVICCVDWIGIGNGGQSAWKEALAEAAETHRDRVLIHTLHQHDAPVCDFEAFDLLNRYELGFDLFDPVFARETIANAAKALRHSLKEQEVVTHVGLGEGLVDRVASNRRILGENGKVVATRYTACKDPKLRALPVGTVDPMVRLISFWHEDRPLLALSFFATHPQSYYLTGGANPDFPGMARSLRETAMSGLPHVHFAGAGGNVGAGKWNDGSKENRIQLAIRLAAGMKAAWEAQNKEDVKASDLSYLTRRVRLPLASHLERKSLENSLANESLSKNQRESIASHLAWVKRQDLGFTSLFSRVRLGSADLLFCPGEMVVEYQLAASEMNGERFTTMAAYGDYGPGYICLSRHYEEGGYESSPRASRVAPSVEKPVMETLRFLLER